LIILTYILLFTITLYFTTKYVFRLINEYCCYNPLTQPKPQYFVIIKPPRISGYFASYALNPMLIVLEWYSKEINEVLNLIEEKYGVRVPLLKHYTLPSRIGLFFSIVFKLTKHVGFINAVKITMLLFRLRSMYIVMHYLEKKTYGMDLDKQFKHVELILSKAKKNLDAVKVLINASSLGEM